MTRGWPTCQRPCYERPLGWFIFPGRRSRCTRKLLRVPSTPRNQPHVRILKVGPSSGSLRRSSPTIHLTSSTVSIKRAFDEAMAICTVQLVPDAKRAFRSAYRSGALFGAAGFAKLSTKTPTLLPSDCRLVQRTSNSSSFGVTWQYDTMTAAW